MVGGAQVFVARAARDAEPIAVSAYSPEPTLTLRWVDARTHVFDRMGTGWFGEGATIVKVTLDDSTLKRLRIPG